VVVVLGVIVGVAFFAGGSGAAVTGVAATATAGAAAQIHADHGYSGSGQPTGGYYVDMSYAPPLHTGPAGGLPPEGHHEWGDYYDYHARAPHPTLAAWRLYEGYHEAPQGW